MHKPQVSIIVAYDKNRTIGFENKIPWYIPEDLQFFKETTINNVVIMGKNTWVSIMSSLGKPLPDRLNIVVSPSIVESYTTLYDNKCQLPKNMGFLPIKDDDRYCVITNNVVFTPDLESAIGFSKDNFFKDDCSITNIQYKTVYIIGGEQLYREALRSSIVNSVIATEIDDMYLGDTQFPLLPNAPYYRYTPEYKWEESVITQSTKSSTSWIRKIFTKVKI